jgi:hypothetical protein
MRHQSRTGHHSSTPKQAMEAEMALGASLLQGSSRYKCRADGTQQGFRQFAG